MKDLIAISSPKIDTPASEPGLSPEEREKILFAWNRTENDYPRDKTLQQLFEKQVESHPDHIALSVNDKAMTYAELNARSNQLANYLCSAGIKSEDFVAICMEPSFDLFVGILGILKAGCTYVPLDPNYPAERRQFMLDDTQASMLITHSSLRKKFRKLHVRFFYFDENEEKLNQQANANLTCENTAESLAYVIYTSGSTGKPKGVMLTQHNVHNFINWFTQALSVSDRDIFDFSSSISFDFSVATTIVPLVNGAKIAICPEAEKKDPSLYLEHLQKNKVSVIKITPSYFRQLKEFITPEFNFPALRWVVFGGESLFAQDIKEWLTKFPQQTILNEYGPTEAAVATSWIKVDKTNIDQFNHLIPIGKPAFNTQIYILDSNLQPVAIGSKGELYIGGEGVARGYLNRPDTTEQKFIQNPFINDKNARLYRTGDLCRFLPDGNIEFIARVDHQVKIRGFRIETAEIEMRLTTLESINEAIVIAKDDQADQAGEKKLVAYCLLSDSAIRPDTRFLREYLHKSLPEYMIPAAFVLMDKFPMTINGKLDRNALPEPEQDTWHRYCAPRSALEQIIADIWSEALNIKLVSVDENFFELGGHSLSATRIISKIIKTAHKEVKLTDLYNAPTIRELAIVVSNAKDAKHTEHTKYKKTVDGSSGIPLCDMQSILWLMQKLHSKQQGLNIVSRKQVGGKLDVNALNSAFKSTLSIHEILRYYIPAHKPKQYLQQDVTFILEENELSPLSPQEQNDILVSSQLELKQFNGWKKGYPLIKARLFYLGEEKSELQIAMAHLISDEISPEIVFADLSRYYLSHKYNKKFYYHETLPFKDYVMEEKSSLDITLSKDISFWDQCLREVNLFVFTQNAVLRQLDKDKIYTTYIELPNQIHNNLQEFCAQNRLSIVDSLCAAVGSVMTSYLDTNSKCQTLALNLVKSTRHDDVFDHTIGFFVKTDLIVMDPAQANSFVDLAKQVQQSTIKASPHQFCPMIVKFASLFQKKWKNKKIKTTFINLFASVLTMIFPSLQLNKKVLGMYGKMMIAGTKNNFLVQVNVFNNFVTKDYHSNKELFGYQLKKLDYIKDDRMVGENVLDICFERNNHHQYFIIISGNLTDDFRAKIGSDILAKLKNI